MYTRKLTHPKCYSICDSATRKAQESSYKSCLVRTRTRSSKSFRADHVLLWWWLSRKVPRESSVCETWFISMVFIKKFSDTRHSRVWGWLSQKPASVRKCRNSGHWKQTTNLVVPRRFRSKKHSCIQDARLDFVKQWSFVGWEWI